MRRVMYGLALSQSGALVLTAWAALATAVATVGIALFALFPARTALAELKASRDQRGWRKAKYEQAFQDALRRAWIEAHSGHDPRVPLTGETIKVLDAFTGVPDSLRVGRNVDGWRGVVWPEIKNHILND